MLCARRLSSVGAVVLCCCVVLDVFHAANSFFRYSISRRESEISPGTRDVECCSMIVRHDGVTDTTSHRDRYGKLNERVKLSLVLFFGSFSAVISRLSTVVRRKPLKRKTLERRMTLLDIRASNILLRPSLCEQSIRRK